MNYTVALNGPVFEFISARNLSPTMLNNDPVTKITETIRVLFTSS